MCVSIINGETDNHTIQEKEPTRNNGTSEMDNSAVILGSFYTQVGWSLRILLKLNRMMQA